MAWTPTARAVAELNACNAEIRWTVHLVNAKSAWYQFQLALDIPESKQVTPSFLRNASVEDRSKLVIDPGSKSISGKKKRGLPKYIFRNGRFRGKKFISVNSKTDRLGRLIVLGGFGDSASVPPKALVHFANNEGWHDDVSDGPVTAEVTIRDDNGEDKALPVTPAWVVVAPPNFAPLQKSVRTMWDLMRDLAIGAKTLPAPALPSFNDDIRPDSREDVAPSVGQLGFRAPVSIRMERAAELCDGGNAEEAFAEYCSRSGTPTDDCQSVP